MEMLITSTERKYIEDQSDDKSAIITEIKYIK
jgi:hypothetical protein